MQFEENLEEFLDNKSNTSAFQNVKTRVIDLKDQLFRLKEKEKARIKKAAGDKGKELTEEEIAQMMFEDEYETGGKVLVLFSSLSISSSDPPFFLFVLMIFGSAQFHNPLMQRSRSTYRKRGGGGGDSSDSSDDDDKGKKPVPTRKRTVRKTKTGDKEGGDDVTAPTAPGAKKTKKKNAITAMWSKKDSDSDHEWENNLDDFLSKKSTVSNLADMIPTENWDLFKDRVRKFRKAGAKADEKKAQGPKASEYALACLFLLLSLRIPAER